MAAANPTALLEKLNAAELRIGMCDDAKLAKLLDPALINILNFLASPLAPVKTKTMEILSHLNKRLKADASIALPVRNLITLFTTPTTASFVQNFALVYIEMGLPRVSDPHPSTRTLLLCLVHRTPGRPRLVAREHALSSRAHARRERACTTLSPPHARLLPVQLPLAERAKLLPSLLVGVAQRPVPQQDALLAMLLPALSSLPLPKTRPELGGVAEAEADGALAAGGASAPAASSTIDSGRATATASTTSAGAANAAASSVPSIAPTLPFLLQSADRALVLAWLLDLLLYLPPLAASPHVPAPGLSRAAAKRVCGKLQDTEVRGGGGSSCPLHAHAAILAPHTARDTDSTLWRARRVEWRSAFLASS